MRSLIFIIATSAIFSASMWAQEHKHDLTEQELGSVHFSTSCAKSVTNDFTRAVALLHSFQYEQAEDAFAQVAGKDPNCAMAYWGVAMANYHGLWGNGDLEKGRVAWSKAHEMITAKPVMDREKAYIDALGEIYAQDGKDGDAHARLFEQKMAALQEAYPNDTEAAIFHALALAITASKTDKTYANQRKCGEILEPIFEEQPHHPGVAHYLIHCYDNPVLAESALPAARAYAKIAPAAAHAHHMPSHIFTRLGLWDESIASNVNAATVAAKAEADSKDGEARDQRLHAMDYLEYAYLQSGRVKQATAVLEEMRALPPLPGRTPVGNYATAAIPARHALELGNWAEAIGLQVDQTGAPWTQAITWAAIGIGSARSGKTDAARQAERALASLRDALAKKDEYWSKQVEVQHRVVAGWIAEQAGQHDDALRTMRGAADLEDSMEKAPVTPGAIRPAREMLAEILLQQHQPQQALAEYESVLARAPNRFNALYGAAVAAEAEGNATLASTYFRKLTETAVGEERPELETARKKLMLASN